MKLHVLLDTVVVRAANSTIPEVRQPEQILSYVCLELSECREWFPITLEKYVILWWCIRPRRDTKYASLEI